MTTASQRPRTELGPPAPVELLASLTWGTGGTPAERLQTLGGGDAAADDRYAVVFAGRLFDEPTNGTHPARAVLSAFRRGGEVEALRLKGVFALVVFDAERGVLHCIRDALGIYPLFFAETSDGVLLSTSPEKLAQNDGVSPEVNRAALVSHLSSYWPDPEETYFEAVRRVPPGHVTRIRRSGSASERYWNPVPAQGPVRWNTEEELDRFEFLLEQAVERGLALGRAGIFLSGGLDSVSVAALAVDATRKRDSTPPLGLSLLFPHVEADEEAVQRGVGEGLKIPHALVPFGDAVGPRGLLAEALEASADWSAPLMNIWYPAYRTLMARAASEDCRVILTGGGGDEWLGVSPFLAADLLRAGDLRGFVRLWRTTNRSFRLSRLATVRSLVWRFGARPILASVAERRAPGLLRAYRRRNVRRRLPDWLAPDPALRQQVAERAERSVARTDARGFYLREGQLSLDHALMSTELEEVYESGARAGIPLWMPYWDADLVDFLYRTPPEHLNEGGRSKGLVRKMLGHRFPELGFERHKKVLATNFFTALMSRQAPEIWKDLGGAQALAKVGVVDERPLHSAVRNALEGNSGLDISRVWNLLSLEGWVRPRV